MPSRMAEEHQQEGLDPRSRCSSSFSSLITGKPAPLLDENNPDWTPTVNMGYETKSSDVDRYRRTDCTSLEPETPCFPPTPSSDDTLPLAESKREGMDQVIRMHLHKQILIM